MKKKLLLTMVLICIGVFALGMLNVSAATSGTCGNNLTWTLDDSGTLTISGTGAMTNWSDTSRVPWYSSRTSIKKVVIGKSVTSIGDYAFVYCSSLTSITIPDGVTSIGYGAFSDCSSLTSVTIPDSVASVGEYAFYGCNSLANITIPDGVTSIRRATFCECTGLKSVTIPDSVTSIGSGAFQICSSLKSVTIPDSVKSIGDWAFNFCPITSITIPDGVKSIGEYTFFGTSLTSVTIPNSVTSIGDSAFCDTWLESVYYNGTEADWNRIAIDYDNDELNEATRIYFAYITIYDKDGNKVIDTTQNMGETVDTSSIMVPDGYKLKLYKDEAMTKEYSIETPIEKNLVLYANTVVSVTVDGEEREVNGQIVLGVENADGSYSLPENVVGYYFNDDFVDAGSYAVENGDCITTVGINVEIVQGAQVRYGAGVTEDGKVNDGNGLRFIAQVDKSNFDGEAYGMKIQAEASSNFTEVVADKWQDEDKTVFTVAITNLKESNYNRNYTATPFVKVKYSDGTEKTIYAKESVTRSIYKVSAGLLVNGYKESENGSIDTDYTMSEYLVRVLNAYVNQTGVRLTLADNELVARTDENLTGAYTGDAFFNVGSTTYEDGKYTVTLTALGEAKIDTKLFNEYLRINNNNSQVKSLTEITDNGDGTYTIVFDYGSLGK